jgi:hypothetical protein
MGLVTTEVGDDVLVYDQDSHQIHQLNASSAAVWRLCDGRRSVNDIALASKLTQDTVRIALARLADSNLLNGPLPVELRLTGQTRRKLMKRAALAGAGATIVSITAPLAAHAQSPLRCARGSCSGDVAGECCPPGQVVQVGTCVQLGGGFITVVCVAV